MSLLKEEAVGLVPVLVYLSETDCSAGVAPEPLTFMLPRTTLLVSLYAKLREAFAESVLNGTTNPLFVWLTYQGLPVPWQYPVGAIVDAIRLGRLCQELRTAPQPLRGSWQPQDPTASLRQSVPPYCTVTYASIFAQPLMFDARVTCSLKASARPTGVVCIAHEDPRGGSQAETAAVSSGPPHDGAHEPLPQTVLQYVRQFIKSSHSAMYGKINHFMNLKEGAISDIVSFATYIGTPVDGRCMLSSSSSDVQVTNSRDFGHIIEVYHQHLAAMMRGVAEGPRSYLIMVNCLMDPRNETCANGNSPLLQFRLSRVAACATASRDPNAVVTVGDAVWHTLFRARFDSHGSEAIRRCVLGEAADDGAGMSLGTGAPSRAITCSTEAIEYLHDELLMEAIEKYLQPRSHGEAHGAPDASAADAKSLVADLGRITANVADAMLRRLTAVHDETPGGLTVPVRRAAAAVANASRDLPLPRVVFMIHGLEPLFCTPLAYMVEHYASADCRLYMTVALV